MQTILFNGVETEVIEVDVVNSDEKWNSYLLGDGTVLRQKTIVTKVFRVVNGKDIHGNPSYLTFFQQVYDVSTSNTETISHKE